jgi:hypothetical protein
VQLLVLKHCILLALLVYLAGVLAGFQIEPSFNHQAGQFPLIESKGKLVMSVAANNLMVAVVNIMGCMSLGAITLVWLSCFN